MVTHPAHPLINPESQQRFASQALALAGVLQTTLETNELIALFAKELASFVDFDGIRYRLPDLQIDIRLGQRCNYSCRYDLCIGNQPLGELQLDRYYAFDESQLETIENLLAGLLYPLRNALLYQQALQSALVDPLTGVRNRSGMESALRREIELARRQQRELALILLDIDHFKRINDRFGHLTGDQVLREVAQCAEQTIRDSDLLFRYGGEEFLILLSDTGPEGSRQLAERTRAAIEGLELRLEDDLRVTASFGVTTLRPDDDAEQLFKRVDRALYEAKQDGRNRVSIR